MSKSVFDVVLLSGSTHVVEADKFHCDASGRAVTFVCNGEVVAQFFNVESGVRRPATPDPAPPQFLCASAGTELGVVDFPPSVSIGAINITGGTPEGIRAICAEFMATLKESGPIR
jgi:hypothetical protein